MKARKIRTCVHPDCGKNLVNVIGKLCRYHSALKRREAQMQKKASRLDRKMKTKRWQISETRRWKAKAWSVFSEFVRRKDADQWGIVSCFTCPARKHWKKMQAGHFQHGRLDYDERNVHPQCPQCNLFYSGRLDEYAMRLVRENGEEWVKRLRVDAARYIRYELHEIKAVFEKYSALLKEMPLTNDYAETN